MNITHRIHQAIKHQLQRPSRRDGRLWVLAALVAYFTALAISNLFVPYRTTWAQLGVVPAVTVFGDLKAVLAGFECTRMGYDVLFTMPCDLDGPGNLVYPRLWMGLQWLGLEQSHAVPLGLLMALSFYAVTLQFVGRLNSFGAAVLALMLCGPAAMLLVERANVDIILYGMILLSLAAAASAHPLVRGLGYLFILVPSCLKLLPIFSMGMLLKESWRRFLFSSVAVASGFVAYLYWVRDEMKVIRSFYNGAADYAFGAKIIYWQVLKSFHALFAAGAKFDLLTAAGLLLFTLAVAWAIWLCAQMLRQLLRWRAAPFKPAAKGAPPDPLLDGFRVGSAMFVCTFLMSTVYDYKLVFLLFAVPQMMAWIKHDTRLGPPSSLALLGTVAAFHLGPFTTRLMLDEIVNWLLCGYFAYAFVATLPAWLALPLHRLVAGGRGLRT